MKEKVSLVRSIFVSMILIAVISILLLGVIIIQHEYEIFNVESKSLRDEFIEKQKTIIKNEVDKTILYIEYMKSLTEEGLRNGLKSKTDHGYDIAYDIYNENKGSKNIDEIKKMVKDALRPIRFNEGRGYYFATRLDGVGELFADKPELEGRDLLEVRDTKGKYVIKDMINIAKTDKGGFYKYTWTKPDQEGKDFLKLAYIRYFEPLNWFIGTGEYLDDAEKNIQKMILDRIAEIRFGKDGYLFTVSYDGVTLMNDTKRDHIGKNMWNLTDINGVKFIQESRKAVENPAGGFIKYVWNKPAESKPVPKISFVKGVDDWRWMIGAGVYIDEIDKIINEKKISLIHGIRTQLIKISFFLFLVILGAYITAKYISSRIDKSLVIFSSFFQKASAESIKIDLKEVNFFEFENLALSANSMIDQREKAEKLLRENEEKYRTLFNMESDALALVNVKNGSILDVNMAFRDLFGFNEEEISNLTDMDFSAGPDGKAGDLKDNSEYVPVVYQKKKDGAVFPAEINARNFSYQGEGVRLLVIRDISDRKRLEAQLRQSQKMEAIGALAGGIAHDFNNILSPIMGHAEMLMMGLPPDSHIQYNLKQIYQASCRAREMVRQILTFSRQDRPEKTPVILGVIIGETVKLLRASIPTTIGIDYNIKVDGDTILGNPTQIHQVILNLCTNAAHAMREKGGQLKIELDDVNLESDAYRKYQNLTSGRYLRLMVSDTGSGMDPVVMGKIFEPYFTTKGPGEGTGMGLAVVHGIVLDHKGDIAVESEPGKGSTFSVFFPPYTGAEVKKVVDVGGSKDIPKGNEKILLVDDEMIVVEVLQAMLESMGYVVTARTSSIEALGAFRNNPGKFDLIITDMTMPNMTGKDLAVEILAIRTDIPIILCTGFSEQIDEEGAKAIGIKAFVMKPIIMKEVARTVREALDRKA